MLIYWPFFMSLTLTWCTGEDKQDLFDLFVLQPKQRAAQRPESAALTLFRFPQTEGAGVNGRSQRASGVRLVSLGMD